MISSCFRSSFLSDLFCSHSELKLVANIKLVALKKEGTNSTVGSAYGYEREVNGSNQGGSNVFSSALFCLHFHFKWDEIGGVNSVRVWLEEEEVTHFHNF